jgi:hypothetical protein
MTDSVAIQVRHQSARGDQCGGDREREDEVDAGYEQGADEGAGEHRRDGDEATAG